MGIPGEREQRYFTASQRQTEVGKMNLSEGSVERCRDGHPQGSGWLFSWSQPDKPFKPTQQGDHLEAFGVAGIGNQHSGDMWTDTILANGAGATRIFDLTFKDPCTNVVMMGVLSFAITIGCQHETAAEGMVDKFLFDVLHAPIKLCLAHPGMDDILSNRAALTDTPFSVTH